MKTQAYILVKVTKYTDYEDALEVEKVIEEFEAAHIDLNEAIHYAANKSTTLLGEAVYRLYGVDTVTQKKELLGASA